MDKTISDVLAEIDSMKDADCENPNSRWDQPRYIKRWDEETLIELERRIKDGK